MDSGLRFIPEWVLPFKNEWRSAIGLNKLFVLKHTESEALYDIQTCINKYDWRKHGMQLPHGNSFVRRYKVKDILARAHAHNLVASHRPECGFTQGQTEHDAIRDKFSQALSVKDSKITDQEREITTLHVSLTEMQDRFSDLEQTLRSVKSKLHQALHATDISDAPGLYFMCDDDDILYVGLATKSVKSRVNGRANLVKSCRMIPFADITILREEERKWIQLLQPKGNTQHKLWE